MSWDCPVWFSNKCLALGITNVSNPAYYGIKNGTYTSDDGGIQLTLCRTSCGDDVIMSFDERYDRNYRVGRDVFCSYNIDDIVGMLREFRLVSVEEHALEASIKEMKSRLGVVKRGYKNIVKM